MSNIDLNVDVGQTKTLTFNTKDKYNSEDIVFNIAANDTLADWAKAATKPSYTWSEINNKPTFATVATSGSYSDLSNKPTLSTFGITATAAELNYTDGVTSNIQTQLNGKVTTNSDATLTSLNIKDSSNNQVLIATTPASLISFSDISGNIPFVIRRNTLEIVPGAAFSNKIGLGLQNQYWKEVWAGKYKIPGGTSSQFLKADGSVDSTSYATLDSNGKVPTSQLPVGIQGVTGIQGSTGTRGVQGYQGIKGLQGTTGLQGPRGYQGYTGGTGLQGKQGLQGTAGTNGTNGAQGSRGYQGYTGAQGATGLQGKNGSNGTNGVQGATGLQGSTGSRGYQGYTGLQGTTGLQGSTGSRGYQGYTGLQGTTGLQGSTGAQGPRGYQGYTGGTGLQGKQGLQGTAGTNGTNGVQGKQGLQGTAGTNGTNGAQGYRGYQGYTGAQGATGLQGKNGSNGTNGVQGTRGYQGYTGLQGTAGSNGAQGHRGYQGYTGIQGSTGATGAVGPGGIQGAKGLQGSTGTRGVQGYRGYTGSTGPQGPQGVQGIPGLSGNDGVQGIQGFQGPAGTGSSNMEENAGTGISTAGTTVTSSFTENANYILLDPSVATNYNTYECVLGLAARFGMDFSRSRNIVIDLGSLTSSSSSSIHIFPERISDLLNELNILAGVRYHIYLVNLQTEGVFKLPLHKNGYSHNGVHYNILGALGGLFTNPDTGTRYMQYGDSAKIEFIINDPTFVSDDSVRVDISFDQNGEIGNRGTSTGTTDTNTDNIPEYAGTKSSTSVGAYSPTSLGTIQSFINYCQSNTKTFTGMECIATDKNTGTSVISNADLMSLIIQALANGGLIKI